MLVSSTLNLHHSTDPGSRDGEAIETLLVRADRAMRQAKRAGRDRVASTVD